MANGPSGVSHGAELQTWKEIARYLSVTPRTAQQWERTRGLPVHRLPGDRAQVYALPGEIEKWKRSVGHWADGTGGTDGTNGGAGGDRRRRARMAAGVAVLVVAGALSWALLPRGAVAGFETTATVFAALDARGQTLWRFPLPAGSHFMLDGTSLKPMVQMGDLDGDGRPDFLIATEADEPAPERSGALLAISSEGRLRWSFAAGRAVRSRVEAFPPPYRVRDFGVLPARDGIGARVVVTSSQQVHYANQVAVLEAGTGALVREYWHSGALLNLLVHDGDGDGREEVYLGGIHNSSKQAVLVVLDPETMEGASAEENPDYQIEGMTPGRERARVFFPASCHTRALGRYNQVAAVQPAGGEIEVRVIDPIDAVEFAGFHYYLRPDLSLARMVEGDNYASLHGGLRRAGMADHEWDEKERAAKRAIRVVRPGPRG